MSSLVSNCTLNVYFSGYKSSPPIKLKRMSNGEEIRTNVNTVTKSNDNSDGMSMLSDSGQVNSKRKSTNGSLRSKRLCPCDLMEKSVELNFVLDSVFNPVDEFVSGRTISLGSPSISINSHNLKKLIPSIVDELDVKSLKRKSFSRNPSPIRYTEIKAICDDSSDINSSKNYEKQQEVYEMEPMFEGYQLVGDSQLLRFAQYILGMPRKVDSNGKGWLGFCVGGQRICDLHRRVLDGIIPMAKKLIVLIGTNDLLKGTTSQEMCKGLQSLLMSLYKTSEKILLLTLPPVPKLSYLCDHWSKLNKYNEFIVSLKDDDSFKGKLDVIDISTMYYQPKVNKCRLGFFELWFDGQVKRADLIHINESGFKLMRDLLLKEIQ